MESSRAPRDPHADRRDELARRELFDFAATIRRVAKQAPRGFDFQVGNVREQVRELEWRAGR